MKGPKICCHVEELLRMVGGRWKVVLIRELESGPRRHGQLRRGLTGITQKMLTQRLRELERDGVVTRKDVLEGKIKTVEYSLTDWGRKVMEVIMQLHDWTLQHQGHFPAQQAHEVA